MSDVPLKPRPTIMPLSRRRRKWVSRDVSHFQQVEQVGEGTYGYVFVLGMLLAEGAVAAHGKDIDSDALLIYLCASHLVFAGKCGARRINLQTRPSH